jgi:hypothetical protein
MILHHPANVTRSVTRTAVVHERNPFRFSGVERRKKRKTERNRRGAAGPEELRQWGSVGRVIDGRPRLPTDALVCEPDLQKWRTSSVQTGRREGRLAKR